MEKTKTSKLRKGKPERPRAAAPKSNVQDPHAKKSKRRKSASVKGDSRKKTNVATTQNTMSRPNRCFSAIFADRRDGASICTSIKCVAGVRFFV